MKKSLYSILVLFMIFLTNQKSIAQNVSIMSFNIRYDNKWDHENSWEKRRDALCDLILNHNAQIVGTQEGLHNQVQFLNQKLEAYNYVGVGREDGKTKGEYCAIFYNKKQYEVIKSGTFWLSDQPNKVSVGWDAALERICTYGLFQNLKSGKKVWVFNAHFDHIGKQAQENSAHLIVKKINKLTGKNEPVVLMGDLNVEPHEKCIQIISENLKDGMQVSKNSFEGSVGTFNAFSNDKCTKRIDYCFVRNVKVKKYAHINERMKNQKQISDHYPVLIEVKY
jgi:endonuclease/exonuclease/phosphatase family metal-dependent hydrolase